VVKEGVKWGKYKITGRGLGIRKLAETEEEGEEEKEE
jgi:hypothetical protein